VITIPSSAKRVSVPRTERSIGIRPGASAGVVPVATINVAEVP